jgi:phage terminase small subunit
MKGRPRTSDAEKKLKGTYQKCRSNADAPVTDLVDLKPSQTLTGIEKNIWARTSKFLSDNSLIGDVDGDMLTVYCVELGKYFTFLKMAKQIQKDRDSVRKKMEKEGADIVEIMAMLENMPNAYMHTKLADSAFDKAIKISDRYGFTPAARQKLKVQKAEEQEDPLMRLLNPQFKSTNNRAEA